MGFPVNKDTPIEKIAASVDTQMKTLPGPIMVHTTYSKAPGLSEALDTPSFFNDRLSKESSIQRFKTEGGAFVAAGCAEGLDLPGDLCRLNIIPKLNYPDLSDPAVKRRRGEADGETWYMLETLKQTIQQSGRSTRHEADWSNTVVMDPQFSRYVNKCYKHLPKYFTDAIRWDGKGEVRG
jgi:Rad3-related DNA helicase